MKIKKILYIVIEIIIILSFIFVIVNGKSQKQQDTDKIKIVTSNFASYDFLRAIIGETRNIELTFLVGPGIDAHAFDPTAKDLITIQDSDVFVYVGGEMEKWANKVIDSMKNTKIKTLCISQFVDTIKEQEVDGAEEHEETDEVEGAFDEHIWTSPKNSIKMVEILAKMVIEIDNQNIDKYQHNKEKYIAQINNVDKQIKEVINKRVRNRLVFGDRMPMQYFINYYGLDVSAAFPGCSTETEPSASTIAYLEDRIKKEKIPVILYIELNNGSVANTIANDIKEGCEALQIQTLHNISYDDFKNGETWVSLMTRNIDVLKKALN